MITSNMRYRAVANFSLELAALRAAAQAGRYPYKT
jgi:hypothetical protein